MRLVGSVVKPSFHHIVRVRSRKVPGPYSAEMQARKRAIQAGEITFFIPKVKMGLRHVWEPNDLIAEKLGRTIHSYSLGPNLD
ncbi:hypothetical protein V6N12_044845 [Hibiscus sabdariffa]|uniref:Uncharacterized protein n=1 Tax=Hibiscus sabdariffa TaxID=183260 RepID=A0ABR2BBT0_9ROSI